MLLTYYRMVLWLKLRHAQSSLTRVMYVTGSDYSRERDLTDRMYQIYVLVFLIIAVFLSWLGLLSTVSKAFISRGLPLAELVLAVLPPSLMLLFLFLSLRGLRSSPIKLSHEDISFLAASPIPVPVLAHCELGAQLICGGLVGVFTGYLLQTGVHTVLPDAPPPLEIAILVALAVVLICIGSWIPAVIRLRIKEPERRAFGFVTSVFLLVFCGLFLLLYFKGESIHPVNWVMSAGFLPQVLMILAICLALLFVLTQIIRHISATVLIEENALYADLFPLRLLQFYDAESYRNLRRRKKLAFRSPGIRLPFGVKPETLLSRAVLAHMRQFESVPPILCMGFLIAPIGALLFIGNASPLLILVWTAALLLLPVGPRDMTLVFSEDQRNRMLRDHLPFSTSALFFQDTLPAFVVSSLASVSILALALPIGVNMVIAILLALLINAAVVLCIALEHVHFLGTRRRLTYEISLPLLLFVMYVCGLTAPVAGLLAGFFVLGCYTYLLVKGREV